MNAAAAFALLTLLAANPPDLYCSWLKIAPLDMQRFLSRLDGCTHWAGEEGYDGARRREIERAEAKLRCDRIDADLKALRRRHAHARWLTALLDRTERNEDLPYCGAAQ